MSEQRSNPPPGSGMKAAVSRFSVAFLMGLLSGGLIGLFTAFFYILWWLTRGATVPHV